MEAIVERCARIDIGQATVAVTVLVGPAINTDARSRVRFVRSPVVGTCYEAGGADPAVLIAMAGGDVAQNGHHSRKN
jgi:hypothetical protein